MKTEIKDLKNSDGLILEKEINKSRANFEVKAINDGGNIRVSISKEIADRDGEVVDLKGLNIENFKKNPIMIWNHRMTDGDVEDVIGRLEDLVLTKDVSGINMLVGNPKFADHPKAQYLKKMVQDGIISTLSIGFGVEERDSLNQSRISKSELYEVSWVIVPANTEARVLSKSLKDEKELTDEMYKKLLNYDDIHMKIKEYRKQFMNNEFLKKLGYEKTGVEEVDIETIKQLIIKAIDSIQEDSKKDSKDEEIKEDVKVETQPEQKPSENILSKEEAIEQLVAELTAEN